jgi:hypothetical protein
MFQGFKKLQSRYAPSEFYAGTKEKIRHDTRRPGLYDACRMGKTRSHVAGVAA